MPAVSTVALQQVSSRFAQENAGRTLDKPIGLKYIARYLPSDLLASLEASCTGGAIYVWGSKDERVHQTRKVVGKDSLFLFRRGPTICKYGIVLEKIRSRALAESLWGLDAAGESWSTIYFFVAIHDKVIPAIRVNECLGRSSKDSWQGLVVLSMKESENTRAFFLKASPETLTAQHLISC
jgi:hypothetical protein